MAFSQMSFMDALRVASKTKDAPSAWLPNRHWPAELTDPAFSPTVKKRKPITFEPYEPPHLTSLSAPDGGVPVVSSPSCSVSSTKLLVMPSGPFRIESPAYGSYRETTSQTFEVESDPPLLRAMSTPAHPSSSSALRDVSPLRLAEPPLLRTSTCRAATRSSLSRVLGNRIGELATSSSEPFLASDSELPKTSSSNQLTSQAIFQQSRAKREFASCNDVTSTCSLGSGSDWVNSSALTSSLRGEKAGRSVADLMDPGRVMVPELGKAVRLLRRKLSQERQHQQQKNPVPLATSTREQQKQSSPPSQLLVQDPMSSVSVPTEENHSREFSLPEILQWEGQVIAKGAAQQPGGASAMKLSGVDDRAAEVGAVACGDAQPARADAEGFGGEVRDEDKLCIHELLGQITGEYGGGAARAAIGNTAERMECDGQAYFVSNHSVPSNFTPLPAPEAGISASPNVRRKRPPPPPPLVDVANVACAAFAEMCTSEGGVASYSPDEPVTAVIVAAGGTGAVVTPPAEASAAASIAATAELPCPTPTGWGTNQWDRFLPAEPPTPSGMGHTAASVVCAGNNAPGGSGAVGADGSGGHGGNGSGFASLWSEAWTEGFNVDLSGLTGNPALW